MKKKQDFTGFQPSTFVRNDAKTVKRIRDLPTTVIMGRSPLGLEPHYTI